MSRVELLVGPTGSGKTARLVEHVRFLIRQGERPDRILVLVSGAAGFEEWRRRLGFPAPGLYTYHGFVTAELRLHWPWLRPDALAPFLIDADVTLHLLRSLLAQRRADGPLGLVRATDRRLAQLLDGFHWAIGGSGLGVPAAVERLVQAGAAEPGALAHAAAILQEYREVLRAAGALDLPMAVEQYSRQLFPLPQYRERLRLRFSHAVADDLHELPPALQDVVAALAGEAASARLAAATDGGRAGRTWDPLPRFREAVPDLAIVPQGGGPAASAIRHIRAEFRSDMLEAAVQAVAALLEQGVAPGEIAILSPWPDGALRAALDSLKDVPVLDLSPAPLAAQPCVRALLALVALARPGAIRGAVRDLIREGIGWLLQLDPVRAAILVAAVTRAAPAEGLEPSLLQRVGFATGQRWDRIRAWLREPLPDRADQLVGSAVTEVIAPLTRDPAALAPCTRAATLAHQLHRVVAGWPQPDLLARVVDTIAYARWDPPLTGRLGHTGGGSGGAAGALLLTTPWRFLSLGREVRVQVWVDAASASWLPAGTSVLSNPHVLGPTWPVGARWTDARESAVRQESATRTIEALLRRCLETVLVASSALDDAGHETQGGLLPFLAGGAAT